jgi:hypothetical protein
MKERWTEFYTWAKEHNPPVNIIQKDGSHYSFGRGFWNTPNSDIFVLGDDNRRLELLEDVSNLTSNLMVSKKDWENFEKSQIAEEILDLASEPPLDISDNAISKFTWRQRRYGANSKTSPHFQVMVEVPEIGDRYKSRKIDKTKLSDYGKPCHAAITLILENRETFITLVANNVVPGNDIEKDFLDKLDIALEIIRSKNYTRRDQIFKYKWHKLAIYVEGLKIVSDDELFEHHKDFELDRDSKLKNAKILG